MVRRQCRSRYGAGAAEVVLRVDRIVRPLADNAEVVQRVGEIWMVRTERLLLKGGRLAQELFCGGVVAGRGRLLGVVDDRASFARFRHPESRQGSDRRQGGAVTSRGSRTAANCKARFMKPCRSACERTTSTTYNPGARGVDDS